MLYCSFFLCELFVIWFLCVSFRSLSRPLSLCVIVFAVLCLKSDAFDKRHVPHAKKYATELLVRLAKPSGGELFSQTIPTTTLLSYIVYSKCMRVKPKHSI